MRLLKMPNLLDPANEMFGAPLDLMGGIDRVMGDRGMFARILSRFRLDYGRTAAAIRTALAQRLTHTLKGASGLIEARPLHLQAAALEQVLRAHSDHRSAMDRLETELDRVLRELDKLLKDTVPAQPTPQVHAAPVAGRADLFARLRQLLDVGDGSAVEVFDDARGALTDALGDAEMQELTAAMAAFDFERALKLLGQPATRPA
jgi:chemotaxis protein histidine kinase CheA